MNKRLYHPEGTTSQNESEDSLQEVEVGISKEDLIGGIVNSQGVWPLKLGCNDGTDIGSIHANPADVCIITPVSPVEPAGREKRQKKPGWMVNST